MPTALKALNVSKEDRIQLLAMMRQRKIGAAEARRGRILLLAAAGESNRQVSLKVGCKAQVVSCWRKRYEAEGLGGLQDKQRSGRPVKLSAARKQQIVNRACAAPPKHLSRWSVRTLAAELGLPSSTVHRMLVAAKLQPHRIRTFTFSPDPDFEAKLLDIAGLYLVVLQPW